MAEEVPARITSLREPTQCALWDNPGGLPNAFSTALEKVETYEDDSHLTRALYKCRECGQLYFYEWYEWVDWENGNDEQYSTLIPIQTPEQIEALKQTNIFTLMTYFPRLHLDGGKPRWFRKD